MHRVPFLTTKQDGRRVGTGSQGFVRVATLALAVAAGVTAARAAEPGIAAPPHATRANFTVHGASAARSRAIVERAEAVRREIFRRIFGDAAPAPWRVPCDVHVHASAASFATTLGGPPAAARGATSLEFATGRVILRRIDVMGDGPDVMPDALAHEIVHVVLGDRFIDAPPPRWADEGLALLFDPPAAQRRHDADFRAALGSGTAWTVADILALEHYPPQAARQKVFYGQSAALVRWLVARRDAPTFVAFAADCIAIGTAPALARHYGIDSVAELERAWSEAADVDAFALAPPAAETPAAP
jgi:hypothetical protein